MTVTPPVARIAPGPNNGVMGSDAWNTAEIHDACVAALHGRAAALDAEQAVRRLDAFDEVALHPVLADGLAERGFVVVREARYPLEEGHDARRAKHSDRDRCDLVLLPPGCTALRDSVRAARALARAEGTLFFDVVHAEARRAEDAEPEAAYWLEVKVVAQHHIVDGWLTPNAGYGSLLRAAVRDDLRKLASAPGVRRGALLLIVFAADERTARHDADLAADEAGSIPGLDWRRDGGFAILDRLGNRFCRALLLGIRNEGG